MDSYDPEDPPPPTHGGQRPWEYWSCMLRPEHRAARLEQAGAHGWELVGFQFIALRPDDPRFLCVFKRPS